MYAAKVSLHMLSVIWEKRYANHAKPIQMSRLIRTRTMKLFSGNMAEGTIYIALSKRLLLLLGMVKFVRI